MANVVRDHYAGPVRNFPECLDFDAGSEKKNAAEEGLKADVEKNDNNDDNDDWGGTGDDGNDDEWSNVGVSEQWTKETTIAKKLATAPSHCLDSDTSEDENNHNKALAIDAPFKFCPNHSMANKCPRTTLPLLTTLADATYLSTSEEEEESIDEKRVDGGCGQGDKDGGGNVQGS